MKASLNPSPTSQKKYDEPFWAQRFREVGNAELAKEYTSVKKVIRRKTKMLIPFLLIFLLVLVWSKASNARHPRATAPPKVIAKINSLQTASPTAIPFPGLQ